MNIIDLILALIVAATGISRPVDPYLVSVAEQRVVEIQTNFSHDGMQTAEILAWNAGYGSAEDSAERAVQQWVGSPPHWAIMSDPSYNRIGCATALTGDTYWYVCAFGTGTDGPPPADNSTSSPEPAPAPEPTLEPVLLPDTAMGQG